MEIKLNKNKSTLLDKEDFDKIQNSGLYGKMFAQYDKKRDVWYARLLVKGTDGKRVFVHRVIMDAKYGEQIDHKDRNGLNNQKNNLRKCTPSQNAQNRKSKKGSTSKYLGVHLVTYETKRYSKRFDRVSIYKPKQNIWVSSIKANGKNISLGSFRDEIEAAKAYDRAAIKYFGEFSNLNFPN